MINLETAQLFFEEFLGKKASDFEILPQSGSARMNFIGTSNEDKFVITYNENLLENEIFMFRNFWAKKRFLKLLPEKENLNE